MYHRKCQVFNYSTIPYLIQYSLAIADVLIAGMLFQPIIARMVVVRAQSKLLFAYILASDSKQAIGDQVPNGRIHRRQQWQKHTMNLHG